MSITENFLVPAAISALESRIWPWQWRKINFMRPDPGLVFASEKLNSIPKTGAIHDYGFGTLRNLLYLSKVHPGPCSGWELEPTLHHYAREIVAKHNIPVEVWYGNAWEVNVPPNSLTCAVVGITIYNPKDAVEQFLQNTWCRLKRGGILHVSFATYRDSVRDQAENDDPTMVPDSERRGSFYHHCGSHGPCQANMYGIYGASFWDQQEIGQLMHSLGRHKVVYEQTREWYQYFNREGKICPFFRSFHLVTIQKIT